MDKKIVYEEVDLFEWAAGQNKPAAADEAENSDSSSEQTALF